MMLMGLFLKSLVQISQSPSGVVVGTTTVPSGLDWLSMLFFTRRRLSSAKALKPRPRPKLSGLPAAQRAPRNLMELTPKTRSDKMMMVYTMCMMILIRDFVCRKCEQIVNQFYFLWLFLNGIGQSETLMKQVTDTNWYGIPVNSSITHSSVVRSASLAG